MLVSTVSSSFVINYIQNQIRYKYLLLHHKHSKLGFFIVFWGVFCFVRFFFPPRNTQLLPNFILGLHLDLCSLHVKNWRLLWTYITNISMISTFPFSLASLFAIISLQLYSLPFTSSSSSFSLPDVQNALCFINTVSVTVESCLLGHQYDFVEYFIASMNVFLLKAPSQAVILPIV